MKFENHKTIQLVHDNFTGKFNIRDYSEIKLTAPQLVKLICEIEDYKNEHEYCRYEMFITENTPFTLIIDCTAERIKKVILVDNDGDLI